MHKETRRLLRHMTDCGITGWVGNNGVLTLRLETADSRNLLVKIDPSGGFEIYVLLISGDSDFVVDQVLVDKYKSVAEKGLVAHQHKKDMDLVKKLYEQAASDADSVYARLVSYIVD